MPETVAIRPYDPADETALLAVWNHAMWADPIDPRTWRTEYLLDPDFDPGTCLVAEEAGTGIVVGFAFAMHEHATTTRAPVGPDAWVVAFGVMDHWRRQGVGRGLFSALETALQQRGMSRVSIGPYMPTYVTPGVDESRYREAIAFLQALGYATESRPISMEAALTGYRTDPAVNAVAERLARDGVVIRPIDAPDILPLLDFLDHEFQGWRHDATATLHAMFKGPPRHNTMHVAAEHGTVIGFAQSREERFGPFGVHPAARGRGIGAVLLARTMEAMRTNGYHCAWFMWTGDRAARLYRAHGFREVRRFDLMVRDLGGA